MIGIRSYHHFQLVDSATIRCKVTSDSITYEDFSILKRHQTKLTDVKPVLTMNDVNVSDYVAVEYQGKWWLGLVHALEASLKELRVMLLHPSGPRTSFKFPVPPNVLNIELGNVICLLSQPPRLGTRSNYIIPQSVCEELEQVFAEF